MNADSEKPGHVWWKVLSRLLGIFAILLLAAIGLFLLSRVLGVDEDGVLPVSLFVLLGMPYIIGALAAFLIDPNAKRTQEKSYLAVLIFMASVLVLGGLLFQEGVICLLMAGVIWTPMALLGAMTTKRMQRKHRRLGDVSATFEMGLIATIPAILLVMDTSVPQSITPYTVERSVVLDASADEIWPLLLSLPDIQETEGRFTFAQSIAQIPRPRSAVVVGDGVGSVRHAQWGENITFEEHITDWQENEALRWEFVFPNDSISRYTDQHISPEGRHLRIQEGGYRLEPLSDGRTRLTLYTDYEAQTPMNTYAAIWGEIFLGGIQANILEIIEGRLA